MKAHIFSNINWQSYWQHPQEIAMQISKKVSTVYYNPIEVTTENDKLIHLRKITNNPTGQVKIVNSERKNDSMNISWVISQEIINFKNVRSCKKDDILFFYHPLGSTLSYLRAILSKKKRVVFYVDEYKVLSNSTLSKFFIKLLMPLFLKFANAVICTSKLLTQKASRYNKSSHYLPNGVNLNKIKKSAKQDQSVAKKRFRVGFVGALLRWIKIDDFVTISEQFPDSDMVVIGDGPLFKELEKIKKERKLENLLLLGSKPHSEVFHYIDSFDIALNPKKPQISQGVSPIKLFEYWALKKCVLSLKTNELSQYEDKLFFYENRDELISKIKALKQNPKIIAQKGFSGYNYVRKSHDWSSCLSKKLLSIIFSL